MYQQQDKHIMKQAVGGRPPRYLGHPKDGIRNIRSQDYSFPGTFVPVMELSFSGPFILWNIRSLDHSFLRTNKPCRPFPGL